MFVQITKQEFLRELNKKAWYQTNNIIWTIILIYPLFSIVDYIFAPAIWLQFFIVRVITDLLILGFYNLFQHRRYNYRVLLHITLMALSVTSAIQCNIVDLQVLNIYYLMFSAIFLFFNLQAFWEAINSVVEAAIALTLLAIFFKLLSQYDLDIVISNGATVFLIIAVISCLVPGARYKIISRDTRSQLLISKSNDQMKEQFSDINSKNTIIDKQFEQLRRLDEQKNNFINIAGHDLKNLVGSVIMSNNLLNEEGYRLSDEQKELSGYIGESATKMQYLLNKLMDVKEIESSQELKFNPEIFDVNTEVLHIFRGLVETAQIKNIHLIDNISRHPAEVKLDKVFVGQVFQNLLSNAIKFSQTNNNIRVVTSQEGLRFVFEIIDEGIPIGWHELDEMFGKLKTLNEAGGQVENRQGLGLSIAKLMTQEMGGVLTYRSDDAGNYFKVEFQVIN